MPKLVYEIIAVMIWNTDQNIIDCWWSNHNKWYITTQICSWELLMIRVHESQIQFTIFWPQRTLISMQNVEWIQAHHHVGHWKICTALCWHMVAHSFRFASMAFFTSFVLTPSPSPSLLFLIQFNSIFSSSELPIFNLLTRLSRTKFKNRNPFLSWLQWRNLCSVNHRMWERWCKKPSLLTGMNLFLSFPGTYILSICEFWTRFSIDFLCKWNIDYVFLFCW